MFVRRVSSVLLVSVAIGLSACGTGGGAGEGGGAARCPDSQRATAAVTDLPVTLILTTSGASATAGAAQLTADRSFDGVAIVAAYGGTAAYRELARAAITGRGAPNPKYAEARKAAARRCLTESVATASTGLRAGDDVRGDALTAVALGFEAARTVTEDRHPLRIIVYGAGTLVTSGLDLAAADISTADHQDAVVSVLLANGLLDLRGGPRSEVVFAGLSEGATNALVARQREALFQRLCAAVDAAACSTSMGTPS